MANQTGRPIAPARKLVAAVVGTIAVFVMALGLGMSSWGVVLFGLAVLVLSIALGMVNVVRRGARAWVTGTAEVRAISPPPTSSAVYGRAEIVAVVVAPGLPTSEVTIREPRVPVVKWPMIGDTLPITVDVDDMRRVRINWDDASPRDKGADPPPPHLPDYGDLPDEVVDDLDDDLLGDVAPPPWTTPDREWDEPQSPPPGAGPDVPVVVRDTPAGPVVEGELVHHYEEPQPLPRRAGAAAATAGAAAAGAGAESGAGAGRPAGTRPSPRPRGGTATATAEPVAEAPPTPRAPQEDALPVDVPLDEPVDEPDESVGQEAGEPWRRPEPTVAATAAEPSPVTSFPKAPEPTGPPPTAPEPSMPRPSVPEPRAFDDIDLPLDEDADAGEATPPAEEAEPPVEEAEPPVEEAEPPAEEAEPPAEEAEPPAEEAAPMAAEAAPPAAEAVPEEAVPAEAAPAVGERRTTKFVSNAAHDEEAGASSAPASEGGSPGVIAGAAAAAGAVAAAAVAAVKKIGHSDKRAEPDDALVVEEAPAGNAPADERGEANPWAAPPPVNVEADEHADELITAYPSARPGAAGAIYGVGITVLVTDLARSIAFYRDTLGFYEIDSGDGSAVLASGDTRLVLRTVSELSAEAGRLIFLNLEVGDVEAVYAELAEKGVRFVHPPQPVNRGDRLELWSATFLDPDDHNIAITQWRAIR